MNEPYGAYVHVPWCRARCPYCAFAVVPLRGRPDWRPFADGVARDRSVYADDFPAPPATVFFGGGTPSRLPPEAFETLLEALSPAPGAEISAEVNPEDVDPAWAAEVVAAGVDRISIGVQSFVPHVARWLGRGHTQRHAQAALSAVLDAGARSFSVDLIFAVPGQSLADLDVDLDQLLAYGVPHVSLYGLTFEPGTRHGAREAVGRVKAVDDDLWRAMYDHIVARLSEAGLERYEVSNFARSGHASVHNQWYWRDAPYLGLGPSAHGYLPDGTRVVHRIYDDWLAAADPAASRERPSAEERFTDLVVSMLRGVDGLDLARAARTTGLVPDARVIDSLVEAGVITRAGARIALTARGFPVCDGVAARLARGPVTA